jgi:BolA family transcriptional regulator, general stress-responsive regulator
MKNRITAIEAALQQLAPSYLQVIDDSAAHVGHPGAAAGGGHFTIIISAACLQDLSRVKAHQIIYQALGDLMQHEIHAVNIKIKE